MLEGLISKNLKMTALVNAFSAFKIPLLAFVTPKVLELDDSRAVVRVRLDMRTRNHLGVMYFGALAMGAELSIALRAIQTIAESGKKVDFIFKDFQAEFLKRADSHVNFVCEEGKKVAALVQKTILSGERENHTFSGYAYVPSVSDDPVMKYKLTLSVKLRSPK